MLNQPVILHSGSGKTSPGTIKVVEMSMAHRLFKTFLRSFLIILCGLISVMVPLLHFILPFIFLGIAIYVGISTFKEKTFIESGHGKCPECGVDFKIMKRSFKFPFYDVCEDCRREIKIQESATT